MYVPVCGGLARGEVKRVFRGVCEMLLMIYFKTILTE